MHQFIIVKTLRHRVDVRGAIAHVQMRRARFRWAEGTPSGSLTIGVKRFGPEAGLGVGSASGFSWIAIAKVAQIDRAQKGTVH